MPRIENSKNYGGFSIIFGNTSNTCAVLGLGFGLKNDNIVDNGANNKFQTSATLSLKSDPAATRAVLELQNTASNVGRIFLAKNTSGVETITAFADGRVESNSYAYFGTGMRWSTSSGTKTDRGLFIGSTIPNGNITASVGSLYVSTATSKLYTKKYGSGNTGWIEFQEIQSGTTAARPLTNLTLGMQYFDTTINKPTWFNGTVWVDSNGVSV